jgi:hypothetical protein
MPPRRRSGSRNYTADELAHAVVRLADLDLALKGGSRLAGELEFERALVDVTPAAPSARSASRDEPVGSRLAAGRGVLVDRAPRGRTVEPQMSLCSSATRASSPSATAAWRRRASVFAVERKRRFSSRS